MTAYRLTCPQFCELKSTLIHDKGIDRILGSSVDPTGKWLDDEGVNAVLARTLYYAQKNGYGADIFLFSSYFWERLQRNFEYACEVVAKTTFKTKSKWLVPICIHSHWSAAVVEILENKIVMLDSLHTQLISAADKLKKFVQYVYPQNTKDWIIIFDQENVPHQTNSYDCGVLMIKALEKVMYSQYPSPPIDPKSGSVYRQQFLELIRISLESGCDDDYTPVILRQPKFNPPIQKDSRIAQRTRSAKFSLSLSQANQIKHSDEAIKMDTNRPNLSHSNESPTKTSTSSPDKLSQTNTDDSSVSHVNQPPSRKKLVQSTFDFGTVIDVKNPNVGHTPTKRSSPSPDIVHTHMNCDSTCTSHSGVSEQSPDHSLTPYPTCIYKHIAKEQSHLRKNEFKHDVDNTQSLDTDDIKEHIMLSWSNSSDQNSVDQNSELQTAKPLQLNTDTCTSESDSDFINIKPKVRKYNPTKSHKEKQISPKCWEELDSSLQTLLPNIDKVTYVVESHEDRKQPSFEGAPKFNFDLIVRINLETQDQANDFLNKMMAHSCCTYRISRTSKKPTLKRVAYKIEMHCQHFKKALTKQQKEKATLAKSKKARKPFTMQIRNKKTQCPSRLTLTGQIPTKKTTLSYRRQTLPENTHGRS